jgi:hypothetical protein
MSFNDSALKLLKVQSIPRTKTRFSHKAFVRRTEVSLVMMTRQAKPTDFLLEVLFKYLNINK